jgi:acyl-coenzyme A synthetase/AMP-(fatty) acid ligase
MLMLVPSLVVFLAKAKIVDKYDLSSLQNIYCGAAPLSEEVQTLVKRRLRIDSVKQAYGMTETTLAVTASTADKHKNGSSGILLPGMKCKVNRHLITSDITGLTTSHYM